MTGSATENGEDPTLAKQAAEKGAGPTSSLIVAAVLHAGVFAWQLGDTEAPVLRLPYGHLVATAGGLALLSIFLIAAFARRSSLSFVVVPAMLVAGAAAHAASSVLSTPDTTSTTLVGVLGFGALGIAINLSFGAAAIASRVAPSWSEAPFTRALSFRLGAVLLSLVVALSSSSGHSTLLSTLTAAVGLVVLGSMLNAATREGARGMAMAELVSALALSLGATWVTTVVGAATSLSHTPHDWSQAQGAMRFAWLAAIPLIVAAVVALWPRVNDTGVGVKRGLSTVLAATIGSITCAGLSQVVLVRSMPLALEHAAASAPEPSRSRPSVSTPSPASTAPTASAAHAVPRSVVVPPVQSGAMPSDGPVAEPAPAVEPAIAEAAASLSEESTDTKLTVTIKIDGPMLPKDAREGSAKSLDRLLECYEKSDFHGEPLDLTLGLLIDQVGSVKQVEALDKSKARAKYMTCMQMAFYRSGFSGPTRATWLEVALHFAPKAND